MPTIKNLQEDLRRKAFESALSHLASLKRVPHNLRVWPDPQPVYVFRAAETASFQVPKWTRPWSWQYFAGEVDSDIVAGEVSDHLPARVLSVHYGEAPRTAAKTALDAKNRPDVVSGHVETRLIRIPEKVAQGLWLMAKAEGADYILPFGPKFSPDQAGNDAVLLEDYLKRRYVDRAEFTARAEPRSPAS